MRLSSPWIPRLAEGPSPADRLVTALAEDIIEGYLETGDRLPAHRDLAARLSIGVGTVTKAYTILERRGLVRSVKGSGMFVAVAQARRGPSIDLSRNAPPSVMTERLLSRTLTAIARRVDTGLFNDYPPIGGHEEHRRLLVRWFAGLGMQTDIRHLLITGGAHHAISVALSAICGRGGTLFVEAQTYPGILALARHYGISTTGIAMDAEGVDPQALEARLKRKGPGPAVLYVTPTMQNPTTSTMSRQRRDDVVSVCRRHDAWIIEDDVYTLGAEPTLPPLAMLAPERTFYANSMSKTLNPTLRIGGLVTPAAMYSETVAVLQATSIMVSPLSCAVMGQWLTDGTADTVSQAIQEESRRRVAIARSMLGRAMIEPSRQGYHVWLPMPLAHARRLELAASTLGILITSPQSTATDACDETSGIRLCLGAPQLGDLRTALSSLAHLLR